jgi:hypothetical protein
MPADAPKRENLLLNIVCNIVIPTLILTRFSGEKALGPAWGLVVALAFPVSYGIWDFTQRRQANFISIIGFFSVLLSGGLGLTKVGGMGFAIKEAAMPLLIGLAVLISLRTKRPLVKSIVYNEQIIDLEKVDMALAARGNKPALDALLVRASYGLAASFLISAVLNFGLARYLLKSPAGTEAFNAELGKMHALSWPVIVLPSMAMLMWILWRLVKGIEQLTGLKQEEIFRGGSSTGTAGKK